MVAIFQLLRGTNSEWLKAIILKCGLGISVTGILLEVWILWPYPDSPRYGSQRSVPVFVLNRLKVNFDALWSSATMGLGRKKGNVSSHIIYNSRNQTRSRYIWIWVRTPSARRERITSNSNKFSMDFTDLTADVESDLLDPHLLPTPWSEEWGEPRANDKG